MLLEECGTFLYKSGYNILVLNLKDSYSIQNLSMHYNPFHYIHSEFDIISLADTLMKNTTDPKAQSGDPFWQQAEKLMYMAFIGYIHYKCPPEEQNFSMLYSMVTDSKINELNPNEPNPIDKVFEKIKEEREKLEQELRGGAEENKVKIDNLSFCLEQYAAFKLAPPKTALSILISAAARLAPFTIGEIKKLTESDDLHLSQLADRKTALFLITSDSNPVLNFLIGILYTQLFNQLFTKADNEHHGSLPIPVRCLLDEFANIGQIPNFKEIIAVIRSRNISANVILQASSDLEALYKDKAQGIIANCDSNLFLGTGDPKEAEKVSKALGKGTIDTRTTGESTSGKSQKGSSKNYQRTGRELLSPDEVTTMKGSKCILRIRGERPFLSDKYKLERHPNYKYLSDADPKNRFDVATYIEAFYRKEAKRKEAEKRKQEEIQKEEAKRKEEERRQNTQPIQTLKDKLNIQGLLEKADSLHVLQEGRDF
jgi:type IV secretion system protein VirD4